jgi:hypothetical protein
MEPIMKRFIASILSLAGLCGSGLAPAAGADLSVKGKLQSGACSVVLGNGGTFDLGPIRAADLATDFFTDFGLGTTSLTITCTTPTSFGLRLQDNRAGTTPNSSLEGFGLGLAGGRSIGSHSNAISRATSNGQPVDILERWQASDPWSKALTDAAFLVLPGYLATFTAAGNSKGPTAFEQISALLRSSLTINYGSELDLSQEIQIDGSATLELVYL